MKRRWKITFGLLTRLIGMSVITVFAVLVMIAVNLKGRKVQQSSGAEGLDAKPALVSVMELVPEDVKITKKYSGTIRPFERYVHSFKTPGRVKELGKNKDDQEFDEGDRVEAGMVLAKLDTNLLQAQRAELVVAQEYAKAELELAGNLKQTKSISDTEFNRRNNDLKIATARLATIDEQIKDGVLRAEVNGVISKRMIKRGESVNVGQTVFEVIQIDRVKLVVGVPESRVRRIIKRKESPNKATAFVQMIGRENAELSELELTGSVFRIGQTSDDKSGLFEVEILLDNASGLLRPGMIGISRIVVDEFKGYRVPVDAAFFRENEVYVFAVDTYSAIAKEMEEQNKESQKKQGTKQSRSPEEPVARKHVFAPKDFEIQGNELVIRKIEPAAEKIIVGGHRRLVHGRGIQLVLPN